jgi:hypothetical protein
LHTDPTRAQQAMSSPVERKSETSAARVSTSDVPPAIERKLSHDPSVTLEYVIESGGGDAEELRRSKELQSLLPTARPDQIVRFLRARKGDVHAAATMLEKHLEWRAQNIVPPLNPAEDDELKEELLKHKFVLFGRDMQGNMIIVLRGRLTGKHTYKDIEIAKRALFQLGEVMESRCEPLEKVTVLSSKRGAVRKNTDVDCESLRRTTLCLVAWQLLAHRCTEQLSSENMTDTTRAASDWAGK